jgi:hypothetical protein
MVDSVSGSASGSSFRQSGGTIVINGEFAMPRALELAGGELQGTGSINASVQSAGGTINPGQSAGRLTITGDYAQGSSANLLIEIADRGLDQYDQLRIAGSAALSGTLEVCILPINNTEFQPRGGDAFQLLSALQGVAGRFEHYELPPIAEGLQWTVRYQSHDVWLVVVPEGRAWTLLLFSTVLLSCRRGFQRPRSRALRRPRNKIPSESFALPRWPDCA